MAKPISQSKKERARKAHMKRALRESMVRLHIILYLQLRESYTTGLKNTDSFTDVLRTVAREHFGEREDTEEDWELVLCQIVTDHAEKEMTLEERRHRDISRPALILEWYADYLERILPPKEVLWESETFSEAKLAPALNQIAKITSLKSHGKTTAPK